MFSFLFVIIMSLLTLILFPRGFPITQLFMLFWFFEETESYAVEYVPKHIADELVLLMRLGLRL